MRRLLLVGASMVVAAGTFLTLRHDSGQTKTAAELRRESKAVELPADLAALIDRADRLVVYEEPVPGSSLLFQSTHRRDLEELKASLHVNAPDRPLACMCLGTPAIFLYSDGKKIGQITNHHGETLQCSLWESHTRLLDPEPFLRWFDDRKVSGPRKEVEASVAHKRKWKADEARWIAAMPEAIRALLPSPTNDPEPDLRRLQDALLKSTPDKSERILALMEWYGSGSGPWSGFPMYEQTAENMLLGYSTNDLAASIEGKRLTTAQLEGAARLFGGWDFNKARPNEVRSLSNELREKLLDHSLATTDEDKKSRAKTSFE